MILEFVLKLNFPVLVKKKYTFIVYILLCLELCSLSKNILKSESPVPWKVTLFGDRIL